MHQASRYGDVFLNTAEVIFETHIELTFGALVGRAKLVRP
jgi:hypothetical protein